MLPSSCWRAASSARSPIISRSSISEVNVERRHNARGALVTVSEAIVKIIVDGEAMLSAAEGNGPINALDLALRKDLGNTSTISKISS